MPKRESFRAPCGTPRHHLCLCPSMSPALANHLAIRDHLRANPSAARAYGDLKKRLALEFAHDIDGYVEARTSFLASILREIGFPDDELRRSHESTVARSRAEARGLAIGLACTGHARWARPHPSPVWPHPSALAQYRSRVGCCGPYVVLLTIHKHLLMNYP
ncbi:MAG: GrpB family protein [Longimicrobiales bacterium]